MKIIEECGNSFHFEYFLLNEFNFLNWCSNTNVNGSSNTKSEVAEFGSLLLLLSLFNEISPAWAEAECSEEDEEGIRDGGGVEDSRISSILWCFSNIWRELRLRL